MAPDKLQTHAVILAGGRGTRFWPRSRMRTPKQLLNIVGKQTMLEQTVARLRPLISADRMWTVTNAEQAAAVKKQLPAGSRKRVLIEPVGRNTAAAIALAAFQIRHATQGDALMAVLPADHYIAQPGKYRNIVSAALDAAREPGRMVVLGIPPTRPEAGFGYIQRGSDPVESQGFPVFPVARFTEKPALELAQQYIASGDYQWNAGMFFWRVSTFLDNLKRFLPKTYEALASLPPSRDAWTVSTHLRRIFAKLENISVDYAILEAATRQDGLPRVFVIPAEVGWSDIGSWAAVYELLASSGIVSGLSVKPDPATGNIFVSPGVAIDAHGNLIEVPGKFTALVGVRDLVVVETPDALLIVPRQQAQDVGKVVKWLEEQNRPKFL